MSLHVNQSYISKLSNVYEYRCKSQCYSIFSLSSIQGWIMHTTLWRCILKKRICFWSKFFSPCYNNPATAVESTVSVCIARKLRGKIWIGISLSSFGTGQSVKPTQRENSLSHSHSQATFVNIKTFIRRTQKKHIFYGEQFYGFSSIL